MALINYSTINQSVPLTNKEIDALEQASNYIYTLKFDSCQPKS